MWAQYSPTQRLGYCAIAGFVLLGTGFVGRQYLQRAPALELGPIAGGDSQALPSASGQVFVHVIGGVRKPGLLRLPSDARVNDAIEGAGGGTDDADLSRVNLAAKVVDGSQIVVPARLSVLAPPSPGSPTQNPTPVQFFTPSPPTQRTVSAVAQPGTLGIISLNSATQAELEALPGIGPATAIKILDYRQQHGGFRAIDELLEVSGIGPKKMEAIRPYVSL